MQWQSEGPAGPSGTDFDMGGGAGREFVDTGIWMNLSSGRIPITQTFRPYKAVKFIRSDDSFFQIARVAELCIYPGDVNPRVRWDQMLPRPIDPQDLENVRAHGRADFAAAVKEVKAHLKGPLADKQPILALNFRKLGQIGGQPVIEDAHGERLAMTDAGMREDQSGSMADSVVYGAVCGSIFASLPALETHVVAFDTEVVDLTEQCGQDPVDMLFGVQLGGGTDINKSVGYCEKFIREPKNTLFFLITDLFEGGNQAQLVRRLGDMVEAGVRVICLLALNDSGTPCYDEQLARKLAALGVPCFACTPQRLPELLEGALRGTDLAALAARITEKTKN